MSSGNKTSTQLIMCYGIKKITPHTNKELYNNYKLIIINNTKL